MQYPSHEPHPTSRFKNRGFLTRAIIVWVIDTIAGVARMALSKEHSPLEEPPVFLKERLGVGLMEENKTAVFTHDASDITAETVDRAE